MKLKSFRIKLRNDVKSTCEPLKCSLTMWFVGTQVMLGATIVAALRL